MKIQLLLAAEDRDYTDHLSRVLSEKHDESFEVTVCSLPERLSHLLETRSFDVALIEPALLSAANIAGIKLPLVLWDGTTSVEAHGLQQIHKYRRISHIISDILQAYAKVAVDISGFGNNKAKITAVWSPSGGSGKTTVALAYAARKAATGSDITYLNLELFASTPAYFTESGKSISTIFQNLDGNIGFLLKAIALKDSGSGITYFSPPANYDDMNVLTAQDITALIAAVSDIAKEVVVDLPGVCDERFRAVIEKADTVFMVVDGSKTAALKLRQFMGQHNLFEKIRTKTTLVANKNARCDESGFNRVINLPLIASNDPVSVYKTLSGVKFE